MSKRFSFKLSTHPCKERLNLNDRTAARTAFDICVWETCSSDGTSSVTYCVRSDSVKSRMIFRCDSIVFLCDQKYILWLSLKQEIGFSLLWGYRIDDLSINGVSFFFPIQLRKGEQEENVLNKYTVYILDFGARSSGRSLRLGIWFYVNKSVFMNVVFIF